MSLPAAPTPTKAKSHSSPDRPPPWSRVCCSAHSRRSADSRLNKRGRERSSLPRAQLASARVASGLAGPADPTAAPSLPATRLRGLPAQGRISRADGGRVTLGKFRLSSSHQGRLLLLPREAWEVRATHPRGKGEPGPFLLQGDYMTAGTGSSRDLRLLVAPATGHVSGRGMK